MCPTERNTSRKQPIIPFWVGRNTSAREALYKSSPMYSFFSSEAYLLITNLRRPLWGFIKKHRHRQPVKRTRRWFRTLPEHPGGPCTDDLHASKASHPPTLASLLIGHRSAQNGNTPAGLSQRQVKVQHRSITVVATDSFRVNIVAPSWNKRSKDTFRRLPSTPVTGPSHSGYYRWGTLRRASTMFTHQ